MVIGCISTVVYMQKKPSHINMLTNIKMASVMTFTCDITYFLRVVRVSTVVSDKLTHIVPTMH
jgi:hypothetical protein